MQKPYRIESKLVEEAVTELRNHRQLSQDLTEKLTKTLGDRFKNGWELANARKVSRYEFTPSRRVIWIVEGRKGDYQVIPEIPFCYCDDYYFRVMDGKRGLCYHIVAQRFAEALDRFQRVPRRDADYSGITRKWRARTKT